MISNYKVLATPSIDESPRRGTPSLAYIARIKQQLSQEIRQRVTRPFHVNAFICDALKVEQDILTDSLVYLELSLNQAHQSLLRSPATTHRFLKKFLAALADKNINFTTAVTTGAHILNLNTPADFQQLIHTHPQFKGHPLLRTQLDLFINRGNFEWVSFQESEFKDFLHSNRSTLKDTARINCWESMLYSLMNSGALSRRAISHLYQPHHDDFDTLEELSKAFRWVTAKHVKTNELFSAAARHNPYFIEISSPGTVYLGGLGHDMISFPNSTNQVLHTLITGKPPVKPDHSPTLYSNWNRWTDSRLGNPNYKQALTYMMLQETHIVPLPVFVRLFPKIIHQFEKQAAVKLTTSMKKTGNNRNEFPVNSGRSLHWSPPDSGGGS